MPKLKEGTVTLAELKKMATELKIKGRSKMNKKELMEAIERAKGSIDEESTKTFEAKEASPPEKMPKSAPKRSVQPPVRREESQTRMVKPPKAAPVKPQRRKY